MAMRQLLWGSRPPEEWTHGHASIILGVYTPQIIDAWACLNYFGGVDPLQIDAWACVNFEGLHPPNN